MLILDPSVVMDYSPQIRRYYHGSRPHSSVLLVHDGEYRYTYKNTAFTAHAGDAVYLPKYSHYTTRIMPGETRCLQAEFDLMREADGAREDVLFSDVPMLIPACSNAVRELFLSLTAASHNELRLMSVLFNLITLLLDGVETVAPAAANLNRVRPALDYIHGHSLVRTPVSDLADICGLSEPHFRRLFRELTGMSPVKYRNHYILERACTMLESGVMTVGEVASALNFNDIYTFSVAFRKEYGMSPRAWLAAQEKE